MKKILIAFAALIALASCNDKKSEIVVLSGKIENPASDSVFFMKDKIKKGIPLINGEFRDTMKLTQSSYFTFRADREQTTLFLNPGDSLFISTDMNYFDEALIYGGTSSHENNYLAGKMLEEESVYMDPSTLFSLEPKDFAAKITEMKDGFNKDLEEAKTSSLFKTMETKNNQFGYYLLLAQYPRASAYFMQKEIKIPEEFEKELGSIDLDNEKDFISIPNYQQFVMMKYYEKLDGSSAEEIGEIILGSKSMKIKEKLMGLLIHKIEGADPDSEFYNQLIQENANNPELKKEAAELFESIKSLLAGSPSPKFNYPDVTGKEVSLDDLKGKLVYIDIWATWCVPCLQEIPSMKQLQEEYKDKDIHFVGISIDPEKDYDKWKNMLKDKDLKGYQLFSDSDWSSKFVRDYNINAIPRFLLIDKEGNIISADAPRPSSPQIRGLIDKHI